MKNFLLLVFILLQGFIAHGVNKEFICKKESDLSTYIVYINGINNKFNSKGEVVETGSSGKVRVLRSPLVSIRNNVNLKTKSNLVFVHIPNPSYNLFNDLVQSYRQKLKENASSFKISINSIMAYVLLFPISNNNLKTIYQSLKSMIIKGDKVIVISHSQGNLYANEACNSLKKDEDIPLYIRENFPFRNIQVATPASKIECGDRYTNYEHDVVIYGVRVIGNNLPVGILPALKANFFKLHPDVENSNDKLNHNFDLTYLADPKMSASIYSNIQYEFDHFDFHGFNETLVSYRAFGCTFTPHTKDRWTHEILCKNAKEIDTKINITQCTDYDFVGRAKDQDSVEFSAVAPYNQPHLKITYDSTKGYQAEITKPEQTESPLKKPLKMIGYVLGTIIAVGSFGFMSRLKNDKEENS